MSSRNWACSLEIEIVFVASSKIYSKLFRFSGIGRIIYRLEAPTFGFASH